MKEKIEEFLNLNIELKQRCYDLSAKWSQYRKSISIPDYQSSIYDYSKMGIDMVSFKYEYGGFIIGYEFTDRCGETDSFYTYFTIEEIIDENIIKEKIDKIAEKNKIKKEQEEARKKQQEEESRKRELDLYQELKKI